MFKKLLIGIIAAGLGSSYLYISGGKAEPLKQLAATADTTITLENEGYTSGYAPELRMPRWVMYDLGRRDRLFSGRRPDTGFLPDTRLLNPLLPSAYSHSGYDRGHMAPSYAIGKVWGPKAQLETFLMSNIVPQKHEMNDGVWNSIERMEMDSFVPRFGAVRVVCGPVFTENTEHMKSGVPIPWGCFKAIQRPDKQTIAFLVPQNPQSPRPEDYLVSIDELVRLTSIALFPDAPDRKRTRTKIW